MNQFRCDVGEKIFYIVQEILTANNSRQTTSFYCLSNLRIQVFRRLIATVRARKRNTIIWASKNLIKSEQIQLGKKQNVGLVFLVKKFKMKYACHLARMGNEGRGEITFWVLYGNKSRTGRLL